MNNLNKLFWNNYYINTKDDIKNNSSFSNFIYETYIRTYNNNNIFLKICDLGSGNCRDTTFFNSKGNLCYGVDINGVIEKENQNCRLFKEDVINILKNRKLQTLFDVIYMRWFLHALPYDLSHDIFVNAVHNLKPNGLICIEVRSINDTELKKASTFDINDKSYTTKHKRWLYSIEMCKKLAYDNDCDILYSEEGYFSPNKNTETSNPLLIRFVCRKKLLPYYERSDNYINYKHIIPKMNISTIAGKKFLLKEQYEYMDKLNLILEKNKIKYVAVAGTVLGLNRHGGIIPWDNDIDIGFIEEEWDKLLSIKDELEQNGIKYKYNTGTKGCHLGPIDCFKLVKNGDYYEGPAKTFCSVNEYNNVVKQIFGYTYVYAPFCSIDSLTKRYGTTYFFKGNVNDNFHFKDRTVKIFYLNHNDLSYQLK